MSPHAARTIAHCLLTAAFLASPALIGDVAAQSSGNPSSASAAAQAPPAASWVRSATASVAWASSTQSQTVVSLQADATRTSERTVHTINFEENFGRVTFNGQTGTVADSQNLRYLTRYNPRPDSRIYYIVRPSYTRNAIQAVDYRFEELFGVGFQAAKSEKFKLDLIPAAGGVQQHKNVPEVDGSHFAAGLYESAAGTLVNKVVDKQLQQSWSWNQFLLRLSDAGSADYRLQFQAQLQGTILPHLSLTLGYEFDRENTVLEGTQANDQRMTMGLRIQY